MVHGKRETDLLLDLGLAKPVAGWGYLVRDEVAKALGEEFTYADAVEYTRPAREKKAAKAEAEQREREAAFARARESGKPVGIGTWREGCDGSAVECDLDIVTEYAMPDGTTRLERIHTH